MVATLTQIDIFDESHPKKEPNETHVVRHRATALKTEKVTMIAILKMKNGGCTKNR